MHAVAITRARLVGAAHGGYRDPGGGGEIAREDLARLLAEQTGRDAYDWRVRLGQPLPWVVSLVPDADAAVALAFELRRHGLGVVSCDVDAARAWSARGAVQLALGSLELAIEPAGPRIAYDAIRCVVLATLDEETSREEIELMRAPTDRGGRATPMQVSRYHTERARTRAAYLVLGARQRSVRLAQGALSLAASDAGNTSFERFDLAIDAPLARAPGAIRDARLVDARRARSRLSLRGDGRERVTSNVRETDLAARLIAVAWLEGQIDPAP